MVTFAQLADWGYSHVLDLNQEKSRQSIERGSPSQKVTSAPLEKFLKIVISAGGKPAAKI